MKRNEPVAAHFFHFHSFSFVARTGAVSIAPSPNFVKGRGSGWQLGTRSLHLIREVVLGKLGSVLVTKLQHAIWALCGAQSGTERSVISMLSLFDSARLAFPTRYKPY